MPPYVKERAFEGRRGLGEEMEELQPDEGSMCTSIVVLMVVGFVG